MCTDIWLKFMVFLASAFPGCTIPANPCPAVVVPPPPVVRKLEVMGYYAGWMEQKLPTAQVDFSVLTQIQNFSAIPNTDGTLNTSQNHLSPNMVAAARAAGVKVLLTIGSSNTAAGFRGATSQANLSKFVANIVSMSSLYDGVDVDWEPLEISDYPAFSSLVTALKAAMPTKILAVAIGDYPDPAGKPVMLKSLPIDQINLMTYDLAGPWSGWVTYHNSAVMAFGPAFIRAIDPIVKRYVAAGIPASKIGIGVDFYGKVWTQVTKPLDAWTASTTPVQTDIAYSDVLANYISKGVVTTWDTQAQAAYISDTALKRFISFDNEQSIAAKLAYARANGLRGLTIWELGGGPTLMKAFK